MKKILFSLIVLISTALGTIAIADGDYQLDRVFSEDRTLYYAIIEGDTIPEISMNGYSTVKSAVSMVQGTPTNDNVTIIKNEDTQQLYRFVFIKKDIYTVDEISLSASQNGVIKFNCSTNEPSLYAVILKPTQKYSEAFYTWSSVTDNNYLPVTVDVVKASITDNVASFNYQLPSDSVSGQYGVYLIGKYTNYQTEGVYYTAQYDSKIALDTVNQICQGSYNSALASNLLVFLKDNSRGLYLDLEYFNQLQSNTQLDVVSKLFGTTYPNTDDLNESFVRAVTIAWCNSQSDIDAIISKYNGYFSFVLYDDYKQLKSKKLISQFLKSVKSYNDFSVEFDKATAISIINETEPTYMIDVFDKINTYLNLSDKVCSKYLSNKSKCARALCNKNFSTVAQIEKAINDASQAGSSSSGGSGGGSGGPSSSTITAPATSNQVEQSSNVDTIKEPDEEKIENNTLPFTDIVGYEWAHEAIKHFYINSLVNGKSANSFAPNDDITREEFTKLVVSAFGLTGGIQNNFVDVGEEWYTEPINIAFSNGIIRGLDENHFGVATSITREDMAVILHRAIIHNNLALDIVVDEISSFTDYDTISDYAKSSVDELSNKAIVKGFDGYFNPKQTGTRAEAIQMIYNVIKIR